ncbi:FAD-dependent monooxygenase [Planotetraspora phitsanulokensis]|uniref:Oxidoreductase n=1 Tax=Planotetraspora phitsanulokensis TaxID=575192 RepID=A0A8J3XCR5_9ACTN|nr:FAD-dependent monooxygenase [Planotetraspora phitsanulokensis]GII35689.1 oxidoreductase [Planotetraspora phitsanulokensis]
MSPRSVLISGGGIAGPTLAFWLARHGFRPTVVERSQGLRSSGNPVDVRGPALPVAEGMGIMSRLRDVATQATAMRVVDASGRQVARVAMRASRSAAGNREVELPRGDLAAALYESARDDAEFLFDDTIVSMRQDEHGVDVIFDHAPPRRFDLVIGADGLHSTVRRLAFGPEAGFVRHMGVYVATMPLDGVVDHPHDVVLFNTPGRLVSVHPSRGQALAAFIFRGPAIAGFDHRDTEQHRRIVTEAYADAGWRVPELLGRLRKTEDLYFDSVSQVRLPTWAQGRIALLGDAASCVSLFGDGSSLAMAGAHTLAEALARTTDHAEAFRRYETGHRTLVGPKQRNIGRAAGLLIPRTRLGIAARNLTARVLMNRPGSDG